MEDPDDVALGSGYPAAAGQAVDARGMLQAATDLVNPVTAAREMPWLAGELLKIALGRSDLAFDEKDARFQDVTWRDHPLFRRLGQGCRLYEEWTDRMVGAVDRRWERRARARYLGSIVTGALSPTNYLLTNPLALKRAFETGGRSVLRGGRNMFRDLARAACRAWSTGSRSRSARGSPAHRALSCTGRRSSSCFSARQAR